MHIKEQKLLLIDRALEAHIDHTIEELYSRYKKRQFSIYGEEKPDIYSGYTVAGPVYKNAFENKNNLYVIIIPSAVEIDCDVLLRLGSREKLSIVGVTKNPILADGFTRPAFDFWLHDLRHETVKFLYKKNYLKNNGIPLEKIQLLNHRLNAWSLELQGEIAKITDPEIRHAAELIIFNFHHDRGYPMAPSQYLGRIGKYVEYLLHTILVFSGQGAQVKNPLNIKKASRWIEDFWRERLEDESNFIESLKSKEI